MNQIASHYSYEDFIRATERAHALRSQAIDYVLNDVVAGAVRKTVSALRRGTMSLFRPAETRHW